ncbi:unnamed protein product [Amoebophrya sp. A25]|nr:unnamed protein product [Amoebophrya sp. A25]|eukprot:GSA25T00024050001.1
MASPAHGARRSSSIMSGPDTSRPKFCAPPKIKTHRPGETAYQAKHSQFSGGLWKRADFKFDVGTSVEFKRDEESSNEAEGKWALGVVIKHWLDRENKDEFKMVIEEVTDKESCWRHALYSDLAFFSGDASANLVRAGPETERFLHPNEFVGKRTKKMKSSNARSIVVQTIPSSKQSI